MNWVEYIVGIVPHASTEFQIAPTVCLSFVVACVVCRHVSVDHNGKDSEIVADQASVSARVASWALRKNRGDLVDAIMDLTV